MTAVALLNAHATDPYIVSDTMFSRHGNIITEDAKIWVPARGLVDALQKKVDKLWRISAFMRKTFYLPDGGGIIAWSGDLPKAQKFFDKLSIRYMQQCAYVESYRISKKDIEICFFGTETEFHFGGELTIACCISDGYCVSSFVIPEKDPIRTVNFGDCYCIGSGSSILVDAIRRADKNPMLHLVPHVFNTSTQCLVHRISSNMLFLDSLSVDFREELTRDFH